MRSLYIFSRDLRTYDNRALYEAYKSSDEIIACFIFENRYLKNINLNADRMLLIVEALKNIEENINLHIFSGDAKDIVDYLISKYRIDRVYISNSFSWTEDEISRDIEEVCKTHKVCFIKIVDNFISDPTKVELTNNFHNFYKNWKRQANLEMFPEIKGDKFIEVDEKRLVDFIRENRIKDSDKDFLKISWLEKRKNSFDFSKYDKLRNLPYVDGTSRLSHFISIGAVSVRELYNLASNRSEEFIRQLAWREYYYAIKIRKPWMKDLELKENMRRIDWENDEEKIKSFINGTTGYPIVDAGIRQLKEEGWIHNRVRLIVANFLVKDLLVDWRIGERFFKEHLIDYDEVLNVGNWQWSASVGVDVLPLRVFNPILQSKKYDPKGEYIKKYIPELSDADIRAIHDPIRYRLSGYVEPIVDHGEQIRRFKSMIR